MFCYPSSSLPLLPRSSSLRFRFHGSSHPHLSSSTLTFLLSNPQRRVLPLIRHITHARTGKRGGSETSPSPPSERKSLAVATGELFLGLASLLIRNRGGDAVTEIYVHDSIGKSSDVVMEDSDVIWEQRVEDVEAEKKRKRFSSPGFSFSAAGLLFPYHLGAAQFLLENGYIKETTPLAGSSAGAVVCAVIASGKSMQEALIATKILAEDCRLKGTAFRLGAVLRDVLNTFLPEDVHIRSNGRIRGYLAPRPATLFRNRLCIDGGLTLFMPPTSAAKTVRVCAFPANRLGLEGIGISPDCNPDNRATPRQLFNWALEPADDCILDNLYELGYLDASAWAEQNPSSTGEEQRNQNAST